MTVGSDDSCERCESTEQPDEKQDDKSTGKKDKKKDEKEECDHLELRKYGNKTTSWWNCKSCGLRMRTEKRDTSEEEKKKDEAKPKDEPKEKEKPEAKPETQERPKTEMPEMKFAPKKRYERKQLEDDCKHAEEMWFQNQHAQWWNCADCKGRIRTQKQGCKMQWSPGAPAQAPIPKGQAAASSASGAAPAGAAPLP